MAIDSQAGTPRDTSGFNPDRNWKWAQRAIRSRNRAAAWQIVADGEAAAAAAAGPDRTVAGEADQAH